MKVRFYCDIFYPQQLSSGLVASTNPGKKYDSASRFAFDVEIPDHLIYPVDAVSPEPVKVTKIE